MIQQEKIISYHPRWIFAAVCPSGAAGTYLLELAISPHIEPTDDMIRPVIDFLGTVCSIELDRETIEDPFWYGGESHVTSYQVFETCPGGSTRSADPSGPGIAPGPVDHLCAGRPAAHGGGPR